MFSIPELKSQMNAKVDKKVEAAVGKVEAEMVVEVEIDLGFGFEYTKLLWSDAESEWCVVSRS